MAVAALAEAPLAPYARVKKYLKEGLAAGRWTPGELMPSETELVAEFGVSRMTVNRAPGAPVFHSLIVHHDNGVPLQCEDRYVNPACAPDYLQVDFTQTTPTHYLLEVAPLWEAQYTIEASAPTAREARLLGIEPGDPCLVVVRRTMSRSMPITLARLVHPGSRYQLEGSFSP